MHFRYRPNLRSEGVIEKAILRDLPILFMNTQRGQSMHFQRQASTSHSWQSYGKKARKLFSVSGGGFSSITPRQWMEWREKSFIFDSISDPVALSVVLCCEGTCIRYSLTRGNYTLKSFSVLCKEFIHKYCGICSVSLLWEDSKCRNLSLSHGREFQQLIVNMIGDYAVNVPEITKTSLVLVSLRQINSTEYLIRKLHIFTEIIYPITNPNPVFSHCDTWQY
jgi:hypothetical protein